MSYLVLLLLLITIIFMSIIILPFFPTLYYWIIRSDLSQIDSHITLMKSALLSFLPTLRIWWCSIKIWTLVTFFDGVIDIDFRFYYQWSLPFWWISHISFSFYCSSGPYGSSGIDHTKYFLEQSIFSNKRQKLNSWFFWV